MRGHIPTIARSQPLAFHARARGSLGDCVVLGHVRRAHSRRPTRIGSARSLRTASSKALCLKRVALPGTSPRTQNGHNRNDTRDVSRRIARPANARICRRNCVADDRACARVTAGNLNGKEGVSGSSPEEGSEKALHSRGFFFRPNLHSLQLAVVVEPLYGASRSDDGDLRYPVAGHAQAAAVSARPASSRSKRSDASQNGM